MGAIMIQWYPGHMAKAKKDITAILPLIDIVFELVDARIPKSSQNPLIDEIIQKKPRLVLMNKRNMADPIQTKKWEKHFKELGFGVLAVDAISGYNINKITSIAKVQLKDKILRDEKKGMKVQRLRAIILGIPNVGKSTLINRLVKRRLTAVGNRPGVTKAQQWIRISPAIELLDTPGILWPKFADEVVANNLAISGAIKSEILPIITIGEYFLDFLRKHYPTLFFQRYQVDINLENKELAKEIVLKHGILQSDYYERAFQIIINDFQSMRLGNITLDQI